MANVPPNLIIIRPNFIFSEGIAYFKAKNHPLRLTLIAFTLTGILILMHCISASAQSKSWRQYTTQDGLPSNEVYDMLQDSRGYIWFVTDQGICRFNGYEFLRPVDASDSRGSAAFVPTEDHQGRIWFARLGPSLWYIENDTVSEWKYNAILSKFHDRHIDQLGLEKDGSTWIAIPGTGFFVVNEDGIDSLYRFSTDGNLTFARIGNKYIFASQGAEETSNQIGNVQTINRDIIYIDGNNHRHIDRLTFPKPLSNFQLAIWPLRDGGFIHDHGGSVHYIRDSQIQWTVQTTVFSEKMVNAPNGNLLFASHYHGNPGLFQYASLDHLQHADGKNLLPGQFVTDVLCDREGGWWASTANSGVFFCSNPEVDIYDISTCLPANDVVRLTTDHDQTIYAGLRPSAICAINTAVKSCRNLSVPDEISREIWSLTYDPIHERLWCGSPLHFLDHTSEWKKSEYLDSIAKPISAKKIVHSLTDTITYVSSNSGFFRVNNGVQRTEKLGQSDTTKSTFDRTFAVASDAQNNIWVITTYGLKLWKENQYHSPPFDHPALQMQPRDLEILSDGTIAVGMRADGIVLEDNEDQFIHLTTEQGLTSNFITKLASSPEGEIFACTNDGLNYLTQQDGNWKIQTFTSKQGLPSDLVNDATSLNGELWIATVKGLAHFKQIPEPFPMPNPVVEKISVNNADLIDLSKIGLRHNQNNITMRFYALHYRSGGDIRYRYRLHGADTSFIETYNRDVNFAQLAPGEYRFEVQAQNTDGMWSPSTMKQFVIHLAWWQTWWFRGAIILVFLAGLWYFYLRRLHEARRELKIQNKIRDLEAAALRAQMNPHFIFNCLVSIQQFITENDADSATTYLGRFAKLVRLALHSSIDGRHSLREEVEMLENYLALEQLRFKNNFTYVIHLPPELIADDITLPPMLIQPFVENAIVHGMKKKKGDGRIEIAFSKTENLLVVTVTDNGPGITDSLQVKAENGHKSVGMTLTHRRLDILSGQANEGKVSHENLTDENGEVIGSKVCVEIPVE